MLALRLQTLKATQGGGEFFRWGGHGRAIASLFCCAITSISCCAITSFVCSRAKLAAGAEGLAGGVDADPVIGEGEFGNGLDGGHVTGSAGTFDGYLVLHRGVALGAGGIVAGAGQRGVGIVTSETGKLVL